MSHHHEEPDDLTEEQLDELGNALGELKAEVERSLEAAKEESRPVDLGLSIGRVTRVDALQQQQMGAARKRRLEDQLTQIRSAEGRIASGTYGECVRCELPVGYARLKARPEAPFCTKCQSAS